MAKLELLSTDELAEQFLVTSRTIQDWVAAGMPQRIRSGRPAYYWPECYRWREQAIRDDERAKRHAGGDEEKKATLADAKVRTALAEAEQAEIALRKARSETVTIAFMAERYQRIATRIRMKLVQLPTSWSSRLGACTTFTDRRLVLLEAVNGLLPELRELAPGAEPIALEELPDPEARTA